MTRQLVERNKILHQEKRDIYFKLEANKKALCIAIPFLHMSSAQISDLQEAMNRYKACINSEKQILDGIKRKLASNHNTLEEYDKELEHLYAKKQRAYDCRNYNEVNYIKGYIQGVRERKDNIMHKIESLKRERDKQARYITDMIANQKNRYSKICSLKETRKKDVSRYNYLKDERTKLKNRLSVINDELNQNQKLIDNSKH